MSLSNPFGDAYEAVPSNTDLRRGVGSGLYVMTAGDVEFTTMAGTRLGPYAVTAGQMLPFRVKQVNSGTTATVLVGINT